MKKVLQTISFALTLLSSSFSAQSQTNTSFSGNLTNTTTFTRPRAIGDDPDAQPETFYTRQLTPADMEAGTATYNYCVQALIPQVSGNYSLAITSAALNTDPNGDPNDTFIILYANSFTPATPLVNLMAANDDIDWTTPNFLSRLTNLALTAGTTYYIVVTTYQAGTTGTINFSVNGPGAVNLSTLPVRWLGFTANRQQSHVELNWATATEQNTKSYEVQRSADGLHWNSLGTVPASGYSSVVQRYSHLDRQPLAAANYYRILQRDMDGKENFSNVAMVRSTSRQQQVHLYPNPVVNGILTLTLENKSLVELYNAGGIRVVQKQLEAGTHPLSLQHLPKGLYTLKVGTSSQIVALQ